jgi:PAS domain S-box-containing protein
MHSRSTSPHFIHIYSFMPFLLDICLFSIFLIVIFDATAFAAEKRTLRVGLFQNKPAVFQDENGEIQGAYIDLVNEIARLENWQIDYVLDTWEGSLQRLSRGDIDLMTSISYSLERDRYADFTHESVWNVWGMVVVPLASSINDVKNLDGKTVAVVGREISGINFIKMTQKFDINSNILSLSSYDDVLNAVSEGQVDAGVVNNIFGAKHSSAYRLKGSSIIFSPVNGFFAVPEGKNNDIALIIDHYMNQWKRESDSIYYKSLNYWLGNQPHKTLAIPFWVYVGFAIVVTVVMMLFVWTYLLKRMVNLKTFELQKSEEQLRELFDQSPIGLMLCALDGSFISANQGFAKIIGLDLDVVLARSYWDVVPEQHLVLERQRWRDLDRFGYCDPCDLELNHSDGSLIQVHRHAMIVERDGERLIWSSTEDISKLTRAESEREKLSEQLQQKQKMEAIGTLAGGIAHDFNNILSAIFGYTEQAMQEPLCNKSISDKLKSVLSAASRAKNLVQQILTYSRKGNDNRLPLELHSAVLDSCNLLLKTFPNSVQVELDIDANTGVIMADSNQIQQIVMNLCTNAYHALKNQKGTICVSLHSVYIDSEQDVKYSELASGDYASLRVSDTGIGISDADAHKIFDPFFTTKAQGRGTGLGLSVVHGIVQSHQGIIRSDSIPNEGTTFEILFPLIAEKGQVSVDGIDVVTVSDENLRGNEHILFVDDEVALVDLMKETLKTFGYQVTACHSAGVALEFFQTDPHCYDLVLTDQVMPGITGDALAHSILDIRNDIPIIICTGHSTTLDAEKVVEIGAKKLLMKPMSSRFLLKNIRSILDESKGVAVGNSLPPLMHDENLDEECITSFSDGESLTDKFSQLPGNLQQKLQDALKSWSPDKIDAAIEQIRLVNQPIGAVLDLWAKDFRYDLLKKLYKQ